MLNVNCDSDFVSMFFSFVSRSREKERREGREDESRQTLSQLPETHVQRADHRLPSLQGMRE